jgi:hypothetical protein
MVLLIKDATATTTAAAAAATSNSSGSADSYSDDSIYTDSTPAGIGYSDAAAPPAVLVLLTDEVRVDERAVAQHLGLPRRRLRLASRQEAAAATGYEVGSIPPFGEWGSRGSCWAVATPLGCVRSECVHGLQHSH